MTDDDLNYTAEPRRCPPQATYSVLMDECRARGLWPELRIGQEVGPIGRIVATLTVPITAVYRLELTGLFVPRVLDEMADELLDTMRRLGA